MDPCTHLVCSIASEVIKVVQMVEVTNWERRMGAQGCGGAVPAAPACAPCTTGRNGTSLVGEEKHLAVTVNWSSGLVEGIPCCGFLCSAKESLLVPVPCFSNCVMRVALSHMFIYLFMLHFCIWKCFIVEAVPTALQQYWIRSYMTKNISKQKKKVEFIQLVLLISFITQKNRCTPQKACFLCYKSVVGLFFPPFKNISDLSFWKKTTEKELYLLLSIICKDRNRKQVPCQWWCIS